MGFFNWAAPIFGQFADRWTPEDVEVRSRSERSFSANRERSSSPMRCARSWPNTASRGRANRSAG